jgi:valyl-tRNA synthetase
VAGGLPDRAALSTVDRWVLSRLQRVIAEVDEHFEAFEFAKVCDTLYHFAWDDVCDWYVELAKPVLAAGGTSAASTRRVLGHVLDQLLRLLHPIVPFVTDELWSSLTGEPTMVRATWPAADDACLDDDAERVFSEVQRIVTEVRRFRADQGLKPAARVAARFDGLASAGLADHEPLIRFLIRLDAPGDGFVSTAAVGVWGNVRVELDTRGSIDVAAERARLEKDRDAAQREIQGCRAKLDNPDFADRAPAAVVAKVTQRLTSAEADLARLTAALAALSSS